METFNVIATLVQVASAVVIFYYGLRLRKYSKASGKTEKPDSYRIHNLDSADLKVKERRLDCAIKANESRFQYPVKEGKLVIDNVFWTTGDVYGDSMTIPSIRAPYLQYEYRDLPFFQFSTGNICTRVTVEIIPETSTVLGGHDLGKV